MAGSLFLQVCSHHPLPRMGRVVPSATRGAEDTVPGRLRRVGALVLLGRTPTRLSRHHRGRDWSALSHMPLTPGRWDRALAVPGGALGDAGLSPGRVTLGPLQEGACPGCVCPAEEWGADSDPCWGAVEPSKPADVRVEHVFAAVSH